MNKESDILLSVCMVVYNQEQYVRDALDSVLMQKVNFPIEIIISDDCSKDATPEILHEYSVTFPGIVKPVFGSKNLGYPNNQRRSLEAAIGKYIALCDGDDYWTDPYKLQKQVDYLESHPECAICFHNVMNIYDGTIEHRSLLVPLDFPSELTIEDVIKRKWFLATNSEVFRREYLTFPDWYDSVLHIDYVLNLILSQRGTLHYMPDVMSVYRHTAISVNAQHRDGEWGYMLFHSQTMKTILEHMYGTLDKQFHPLLDKRIAYYNDEIARYEKEQYYEKYLLARMFRIKTYKRVLKNWLLKLLHE
jgi:glycosyltransferase involved in cell wall biosynthesis